MFETLLRRLSGAPGADPLSQDDERLAMAALLVRVARADHDYAQREIAAIDALLARRYGLTQEAARALRRQAEALEACSPDTVRFTRQVKDAVPYEERRKVAEDLWRVVLADRKRDAEEDGFLRLVVNLIGVSDRDSGLARQAAERASD
ncbi:MAG: TerB family tellurite resistance protein [Paracoccaceae bacterium]